MTAESDDYVVIDDPGTQAFFAGIRDADTVHALWTASQMPPADSDPRAYAIWWWYLGRASVERLPDDTLPQLTNETQPMYLAGVACRAPDYPRAER